MTDEPTFIDRLDQLVQSERERAASAQREQRENERMDRIESGLETLTQAVQNLATPPAPPAATDDDPAPRNGDDTPTPPAPPPEDPPAPELPLQRVTRMSVPRIYQGDDEPAEVEYIDPSDGETKKRAGRRKGHPTNIEVENVEPGGDA